MESDSRSSEDLSLKYEDENSMNDSSDRESFTLPFSKKRSWMGRHRNSICVHFFLAILNLSLFSLLVIKDRTSRCVTQGLIYTPARDFLKLQVQDFWTERANPNEYMGMTDSADAAWHELMQNTNIRLTVDELIKLNRTSVPLGDGGFLGMPSVYHELHCLKMIRWALNIDRYGNNFGQRDIEELPIHVEHCIDIVRQSIMCRGDTSPITFKWTANSRVPETDFMTKHECVNWDVMDSWMSSRRVNIYGEGVLTHPIYGISYPNGARLIEDWNQPKVIHHN